MEQAIDPDCGMTVYFANARFYTEHEGTTYYSCAPWLHASIRQGPGVVPHRSLVGYCWRMVEVDAVGSALH